MVGMRILIIIFCLVCFADNYGYSLTSSDDVGTGPAEHNAEKLEIMREIAPSRAERLKTLQPFVSSNGASEEEAGNVNDQIVNPEGSQAGILKIEKKASCPSAGFVFNFIFVTLAVVFGLYYFIRRK